MVTLSCASNQLTNLDISNITSLTILFCYSNQLTSLDFSHNTALSELYCANNQLTSLNVSNNTALTVLHCFTNPLTSLDISNNVSLKNIQLRDMPSLNEVCVWEMPLPEGIVLDITNSPNINFTTDCSK